MKKNRLILFFLSYLISFHFVFADDKNKLSFSPFYSLRNGMLYEYVLVTDYASNFTQKLSELDWPVKNISYAGIQLDTKINFVNIHFSFAHGFEKQSGFMEDYDWLDCTALNDKYYFINPSLCTNKSINENYLKNANTIDLNLQFDINPVADFHILPFAGFSYNYYDFIGSNGYGWYGDKDHTNKEYNVAYYDPEAKFYSLCGIEYKRNIYDFYIGAELNYIFFNKLSLSTSFAVSPFMQIYSIDFHHSNMAGTYGTHYHDLMTGYFKHFLISEKAAFKFNSNCSLYFNFDFSIQNKIYGRTFISGSDSYTKNNLTKMTFAGCEGKYWQLSAGAAFTF